MHTYLHTYIRTHTHIYIHTYIHTCIHSNIDLTITNNNLIADVQEWEISEEESCSDHNFLKYKIGKANTYKIKYNYRCIRYIVKEDKYYGYD